MQEVWQCCTEPRIEPFEQDFVYMNISSVSANVNKNIPSEKTSTDKEASSMSGSNVTLLKMDLAAKNFDNSELVSCFKNSADIMRDEKFYSLPKDPHKFRMSEGMKEEMNAAKLILKHRSNTSLHMANKIRSRQLSQQHLLDERISMSDYATTLPISNKRHNNLGNPQKSHSHIDITCKNSHNDVSSRNYQSKLKRHASSDRIVVGVQGRSLLEEITSHYALLRDRVFNGQEWNGGFEEMVTHC
jgi:hypothetical protein